MPIYKKWLQKTGPDEVCTVSCLVILTLDTLYSQDKLTSTPLMTLTTLRFQSGHFTTVVVTVIFEQLKVTLSLIATLVALTYTGAI